MDLGEDNELLLACIIAGVTPEVSKRLNRLTTSQWQRLVGRSVMLGLGPLLAEAIRKARPTVTAPPETHDRLWRAYRDSGAANLRLYHELSRVLAGLQQDGLDVIVLKGAFLAEAVYRNIALRPMGDIDLLTRREDLSRAKVSLLRIGLMEGRRNPHTHENCPYHTAFTCPAGTVVEIHWDIVGPTAPFKVNVDDFWDRARPVQIADVETLGLCPEDLLLHLCVHASYNHKFSMGPIQLYDIRETVGRYGDQLDWHRFTIAAERYRIRSYVYYPLLLAQRWLMAAVPEEAIAHLGPDTPDPQFVADLERYLLDVTPMTLSGFHGTWVAAHAVGRGKGIRGKTLAILRAVFPPLRRMRIINRLPENSLLAWLYYPVRLWGLARARWRQVLHWVFRTKTARSLLAREEFKETIVRAMEAEEGKRRQTHRT